MCYWVILVKRKLIKRKLMASARKIANVIRFVRIGLKFLFETPQAVRFCVADPCATANDSAANNDSAAQGSCVRKCCPADHVMDGKTCRPAADGYVFDAAFRNESGEPVDVDDYLVGGGWRPRCSAQLLLDPVVYPEGAAHSTSSTVTELLPSFSLGRRVLRRTVRTAVPAAVPGRRARLRRLLRRRLPGRRRPSGAFLLEAWLDTRR